MSAMRWALDFIRKEEADFSIFLAVGPILTFCSVIVGLQRNNNFDLIILAIVGVILCIKGSTRGWIYSAILLVASAFLKHGFFIAGNHLWQMGVEGSLLMGWAITVVVMGRLFSKEKNLFAQIERNNSTIRNLEDDLTKTRQEALAEQISFSDRLAALQKDFDENQSENSSLQILNDVLRKTAAQTNRNCDEISRKLLEKEQQLLSVQDEIEKIRAQFALAQEKMVKQESELIALRDQIQSWTSQRDRAIQISQEQMQEIEKLQLEIARLESCAFQHDQVAQLSQERMQQIEKLRSEANLWQENLMQKESEINRFHGQVRGMAEQLNQYSQTIQLLQKRLQGAAQKEGLYQELRKQFEEKNQVLHQTRAELFQVNTALDALRLEQEQQKTGETSEVEKVLSNELAVLEQERQNLESENEKLLDLVTLLSNNSPIQIMDRLKKQQQKIDSNKSNLKKDSSKKRTKKGSNQGSLVKISQPD